MKFKYLKRKIAEREAKESHILSQREAEDRITGRMREAAPVVHQPLWTKTTDDRLSYAEKRIRENATKLEPGDGPTHRWCCQCKVYKLLPKGCCRFGDAWICFNCWDTMSLKERAEFYRVESAKSKARASIFAGAPNLAIMKPTYQRRPDGHLGGVED